MKLKLEERANGRESAIATFPNGQEGVYYYCQNTHLRIRQVVEADAEDCWKIMKDELPKITKKFWVDRFKSIVGKRKQDDPELILAVETRSGSILAVIYIAYENYQAHAKINFKDEKNEEVVQNILQTFLELLNTAWLYDRLFLERSRQKEFLFFEVKRKAN